MSDVGTALQDLLNSYADKLSNVSIKAVGTQTALMAGISLAVLLAFSFFRPREKKVYAPRLKYRAPTDEDDPPPQIGNGFFSWLTPLLSEGDIDLVHTIGVDAVAFLQFLALLKWLLLAISVLACAVLIPINIIWTKKNNSKSNELSMLTLSGLGGNILWAHVGMTYVFTALSLYAIWYFWRKMLSLRRAWFMSPRYQRSIQSRSLMITNVRKEYQSDEGLRALMMKLRGGNEKIGSNIQSCMIGRDLKDYPELVEDYNNTVKEFEEILVKYLKGGKEASKRPKIRRGGFLGMGGTKLDAIEFYATKLGRLRDILDSKKEDIDLLKPKHSHKHKGGEKVKPKHIKIPAENYGFVSMMDAAQAHAIARQHQGRQKDLFGAEIILAPAPRDIIWANAKITPGERANSRFVGTLLLIGFCFLNTVPLIIVAALANLAALTEFVPFLNSWNNAGQWGNWTFSLAAGVLPPTISAVFGILLPIVIRRLTKYQGSTSKTQRERGVLTKLFSFLVISQFFCFSLLGVFAQLGAQIALEVQGKKSVGEILSKLSNLPDRIQQTYVQQNVYWLTVFPLRGFLVFFELAQLIKLVLLSVKTMLFARTPRDIRDWTRPPNFDYAVVYANIAFQAAVAMMYAPLAPLVPVFATLVFWVSSYIYKYQLVYVYSPKVESGGRMWNIIVNRIIVCMILMQALMTLTIVLRHDGWKERVITGAVACPPFFITLGFKIFVLRKYADDFLYFKPTNEEQATVVGEAKHSYKQRFVHPALRDDVLFTVMVHRDQEDLVKQILAPYSDKLRSDVKGIREKDLTEYNPATDPIRQGEFAGGSTIGVDDGMSTVGSDMDLTYRRPLVPPSVSRNWSEASSVPGGGFVDDGSQVDLIHSAGPMAGSQGWYGQQQYAPPLASDPDSPYLGQNMALPPIESSHSSHAAPLLASRSLSHAHTDSYPMVDLPPSSSSRTGSPAPGYGGGRPAPQRQATGGSSAGYAVPFDQDGDGSGDASPRGAGGYPEPPRSFGPNSRY